MDKLAAYEMLLENHPLWAKEAARVFAGGDGIPLRETTRPSAAQRLRAASAGASKRIPGKTTTLGKSSIRAMQFLARKK